MGALFYYQNLLRAVIYQNSYKRNILLSIIVICAWGGNRTRIYKVDNILSVARIPVPPPRHIIFSYFFPYVLVLNYGNLDKVFLGFLICYLDDLHLYDQVQVGFYHLLIILPSHILHIFSPLT